jgi:hypothetical protein
MRNIRFVQVHQLLHSCCCCFRRRSGLLATLSSIVALLSMAPFFYMELCTITAYRLGWISLWNLTDLFSYVVQVWMEVLNAVLGLCINVL